MIEQRIEKISNILLHLHGAVEQAPTPKDVVNSMIAEVPDELMKSGVVVDSYCGRGTILIEAVARKYKLSKTADEGANKLLLERIVTNEIFGNDISEAFHGVTTSTFQRLIDKDVTINIDNVDSSSYNISMTIDKTIISVTNPPYQPFIGVKKGGNEYKIHILSELNRAPKFGVANIPMTFMVQSPEDKGAIDFRNSLLKAGLKKIKHIRPNAYKANVLTVYIVWEQGYEGSVEFVTYDIDDVNKEHTISIDRSKLHNLGIWPVARTVKEFDLALKVLDYRKSKYNYISNKPEQKSTWCVEWEYLIGMEKERLNRKEPVRGIAKRGPNDTVRGGNKSVFFNVVSEDAADSLIEFMKTVGQEWQRCIPRGSSVEKWMMGPIIEMWKEKNPQFSKMVSLT
jgi:hypothetical protein